MQYQLEGTLVPAAPVIRGPIAKIKIFVVGSLVVLFLSRTVDWPLRVALGIFYEDCICTSVYGAVLGTFTLRKLECFRHALVVNTSACNNKIGLVAYSAGLCAICID